MVGSRPDLDAVVAAAEAHAELVVLEASCRHARLQPKFRFVKEMIDSGKLGTVYHVHHNHLSRTTFVEYNPAGTWGVNKALAGGGPFIDWGVYDLSFHLGLFGDVPQLKSVRSFTKNGLHDVSKFAPIADVEQHGAAWMEFDTGLTYYYERGAGVHGETDCETRIYGTKGGLRLHFPTWESKTVEFFYEENGTPKKEVYAVDMSAHPPDDDVPLVAHFLDCLEGRAKPMMPVQLAAKHMDILFKILSA
jgi:predicted dehydrogenase